MDIWINRSHLKNGSLLEKWVALEKNESHLEKMCHTWKDVLHLQKCVTLINMGHT